jgi:hypothetical protein
MPVSSNAISLLKQELLLMQNHMHESSHEETDLNQDNRFMEFMDSMYPAMRGTAQGT